MVGMNPDFDQDHIAREIVAKAIEFWGEARAEESRAALEATAENIWVVSQNPPHPEQEPAFFL